VVETTSAPISQLQRFDLSINTYTCPLAIILFPSHAYSMSPKSDLAVVICHGSYHSPAPYERLVEALQVRGIEAACPQLPTSDLSKLNVGDPSKPNFDLGPPEQGYPQGKEDADAVLEVVRPLIEQGKKVLLLAHSSGGWVATQVAEPELHFKTRREKGFEGGIIGLFYMGAFIIPVGESVSGFFQPKEGPPVTPPFMQFHVSLLLQLVETLYSLRYRLLVQLGLGLWFNPRRFCSATLNQT
jgi:hypothetical protein